MKLATQSSGQPDKPRRGRPPRFTRQEIVERAVVMLEENAAEELSLSRIARGLGVTPMALYNYFSDWDELRQAVAAYLLADFDAQPLAEDGWPQIALWAITMRGCFRRFPQVHRLLREKNGKTSIAWLERSAVVYTALETMGFKGRELERTTLYVWRSVMDAIYDEVFDISALGRVPPDDRNSLAPETRRAINALQRCLNEREHYRKMFEFQLQNLQRSLATMQAD